MEGKKPGFGTASVRACFEKIKADMTVRDIINTCVLFAMFVFYSLTFFVPKFYGYTEKYVGVFVFLLLAVIAAVNTDPVRKLRSKDVDFIVLLLLAAITVINIIITDSGYGCFFVMADFALVWYLSGEMKFKEWQFRLFGILYIAMILYWFFGVYTWMFADYTSFAMNTNTAATFTLFSMLCVFTYLADIYKRHRIAGLFITMALVKCFQISLYHRSRGAFIMLLAFFVLYFLVPKKMWSRKWFYHCVCILATFGSLAFVALYVWLGTTGINFRMPFFYKNIFSGREAIWLEFWQLFSARPLTGIGTNVTITSFFEFNVHNAMYNILVIHGVIVFALMIFLMMRGWKRVGGGIATDGTKRCAVAALFAVCFESFTDVDLIWVNYSLNVFFLLLALNMNTSPDRSSSGPE